MRYTHDQHNVYAGKTVIGRLYVGYNGTELRILQGMPREATITKLWEDCPEFCKDNGISITYIPKLFCEPGRRKK